MYSRTVLLVPTSTVLPIAYLHTGQSSFLQEKLGSYPNVREGRGSSLCPAVSCPAAGKAYCNRLEKFSGFLFLLSATVGWVIAWPQQSCCLFCIASILAPLLLEYSRYKSHLQLLPLFLGFLGWQIGQKKAPSL